MKNNGAAPCTAMSFTQWCTKSAPTVECSPISKAIFSLVPTPSTLETNTGSTYLVLSTANRPPKPPISLSTPRVNVLCAKYLMRCLVRLAWSMFTPASAYVMGEAAGVGFLATVYRGTLFSITVWENAGYLAKQQFLRPPIVTRSKGHTGSGCPCEVLCEVPRDDQGPSETMWEQPPSAVHRAKLDNSWQRR